MSKYQEYVKELTEIIVNNNNVEENRKAMDDLVLLNEKVVDLIKVKKIMGLSFKNQKKLLIEKTKKIALNTRVYLINYHGKNYSLSVADMKKNLEIYKERIKVEYSKEDEQLVKDLAATIEIGLKDIDEEVKAAKNISDKEVFPQLCKKYGISQMYEKIELYNRNGLIDIGIRHEKEYDEKEYDKVVQKLEIYSEKNLNNLKTSLERLLDKESRLEAIYNSEEYKEALKHIKLHSEALQKTKEALNEEDEIKTKREELWGKILENKSVKEMMELYKKSEYSNILGLGKDLDEDYKRAIEENAARIPSDLINNKISKKRLKSMFGLSGGTRKFFDNIATRLKMNKFKKLMKDVELQKLIEEYKYVENEVSVTAKKRNEIDMICIKELDKINKIQYEIGKKLYPIVYKKRKEGYDNLSMSLINDCFFKKNNVETGMNEMRKKILEEKERLLSAIERIEGYRREHTTIDKDLEQSREIIHIIPRNAASFSELEKYNFSNSRENEVIEDLIEKSPSDLMEEVSSSKKR